MKCAALAPGSKLSTRISLEAMLLLQQPCQLLHPLWCQGLPLPAPIVAELSPAAPFPPTLARRPLAATAASS